MQILLPFPFFMAFAFYDLFFPKHLLSLCDGEEPQCWFSLPLLPPPASPWWRLSQVHALPCCACCVHNCHLIRLPVLFLIKAKPLGVKELFVASTNSIDFWKSWKRKQVWRIWWIPMYSDGNIAIYKAMEIKCLLYLQQDFVGDTSTEQCWTDFHRNMTISYIVMWKLCVCVHTKLIFS